MATIVDVHAHALIPAPPVALDARLAAMDAAGVDVQAVSAAPGLQDGQQGRLRIAELVRASHDGLAGVVRRAPDRLVGIGTVDLRHPDLAAEQLRRAVDDYDFRGVQVSACGEGDLAGPALDPFWSMARLLDIPVFVHPPRCGGPSRFVVVTFDPAGPGRVLWGSGHPFHAGAYRLPDLPESVAPGERAALLGGTACSLLRLPGLGRSAAG